jgi:hypothetical protein
MSFALTHLIGFGGGGEGSWIEQNTAFESDVIAVDFSTLAMIIKDSGTPANSYNGAPASKLTYTSPSAKVIRGADGLFSSASTIRTEYDASGTALGVRCEEARTNRVLWNRDLTNAAWTATNITAAKDQTGIDGTANGASSITATAGNGTILQSITSASAARITSAFVKRITGTGNIDLTQDNGTTWTTVTVTSSWTRVQVPSATVTNPIVGFRVVTSGDAIAVDFVQEESGAFTTSPIATTTATVTRAIDNITMATTLGPTVGSALTMFAEFLPTNQLQATSRCAATLDDGGINNRVFISMRAASNDDLDVRVSTAASAVVIINAGSISADAMNRAAIGVALNDANAYQSGASIGTDTSCSVPTGTTTWRFGRDHSGTPLNGWLKRVLFLPTRRMSNTELGRITL